MFKNNGSSNGAAGSSLIGESLQVEGELICKGNIEVAGLMNGNIKSRELRVLETGSIIGGVSAGILEVFGHVEGEIHADTIKIGKTAIIKGDIFFRENLKIEEGADVDGYIKRMSSTSSSVAPKESIKKSDSENQNLNLDNKKEPKKEKKAVNQN